MDDRVKLHPRLSHQAGHACTGSLLVRIYSSSTSASAGGHVICDDCLVNYAGQNTTISNCVLHNALTGGAIGVRCCVDNNFGVARAATAAGMKAQAKCIYSPRDVFGAIDRKLRALMAEKRALEDVVSNTVNEDVDGDVPIKSDANYAGGAW